MKLEFNGIDELEQFLQFSAHVGKFFVTAPPVQSVDPAADFYQAPDDVASIIAAMGGLPAASEFQSAAETVGVTAEVLEHVYAQEASGTAGVLVEPEAPRRKRRTKAEIEAEKAGNDSAAPAAVTDAQASGGAAATGSAASDAAKTAEPQVINTAPPGNPFAQSPSTQAVLDAPNQQAATLAGIAAMKANPITDIEVRAAELLGAGTYADGLEHLRYCQAFIQKHGLPKYNEGFTGALGANIIAYEPAQRAQHVAVLESLVA